MHTATRRVLLASLGRSWAVVPEAFHLPAPDQAGFAEVHVLTTASPLIDAGIEAVRGYFRDRHPHVLVSITRVAGFTDLRDERDHAEFEEVLHRWILEKAPNPASRHVCIAGGLKTISAAMQKAAATLGAAEVFHVLADAVFTDPEGRRREPGTATEVDEAVHARAVHHVRLGVESGWPQLRSARAADYPLQARPSGPGIWHASAPDHRLTQTIREIVQRSHRIAESWDVLEDLPFAELATWPAADLEWLQCPVDPEAPLDQAWLSNLPKIELHTHLGGFATHGELLLEVRSKAASAVRPTPEIPLPPGWPLPSRPIPLRQYMALGDATGSSLLRDPGCLRRHCELMYAHLIRDHVAYAEIRCSPANYAGPDRSPWTVLEDIRRAFDDCMAESRSGAGGFCHVNLILIATRRDRGDFRSSISRHLSLAVTAAEHWQEPPHCRVVGVDLAGFEDPTTRALYFRDQFTAVHRCGLALTVHAGENDDAEGIWSAVFDLNARRLGHALHLIESPDLIRSVAARRIGVEMCPYANAQIKGYAPFNGSAIYPLRQYLADGVPVTLNTDNIGISAASLTDNFLLAARLDPELTRLDVLRILRNALETAFVSPAMRRELANRITPRLRPPAPP